MTGGLLLAAFSLLIQGAAAVDVALSPDKTSYGDSETITFTMSVTYDTDEHIPVIYNRLIIEGPNPPAPIALEIRWIVNGEIITNDGCSGVETRVEDTGLGAITGYGFDNSDTYLGRHTGYGYDSGTGHGATGYGSGSTGAGSTTETGVYDDVFSGGYGTPVGAGYGYDSVAGEGVLTYTVTVPASCLSLGSYRATGAVVTDYWSFESLFQGFTVNTGSSSGGGSGGGNGDDGPIQASSITPPEGALAAYRATIPAGRTAGSQVVIQTTDSNFPEITLTLSEDITTATQVTVVVWPAATPPPNTDDPPSGTEVFRYLEITMAGGDKAESVSIKVVIPVADTPDALRAAILHFINSLWNPENRITLSLAGDNYEGTVETPCCSSFAIIFDTTPPQLSLTVPAGTLKDTVALRATATDNLQMTRVEFFVDDVLKNTDTTAPFEFNFDTSTVSDGQRAFKAVAYDFVDGSSEASENREVRNQQDGPGDTDGPGDGSNTFIWVLLALIVIALIIAVVVMAGRKPKNPTTAAGAGSGRGGSTSGAAAASRTPQQKSAPMVAGAAHTGSSSTMEPPVKGDILPIADVEGIGPVYAKKLQDAGVRDTAQLITADAAQLASKTGISETNVRTWQSMADLDRLRSVGNQYAELLARSGVASVAQLAAETPESVVKKVDGYLKTVDRPPTREPYDVARAKKWIDEAKQVGGV